MNGPVKTLAACIVGVFALCAAQDISAHDRITTKVSWDREIAPIFRARCVSCHRGDGPSPSIPLTTYKEARPWAAAIKEEVLMRRMPKWAAARGYGDFANDPSLSPFEIALVTAWVDGGAPETTAKDKAARADTAPPTFKPIPQPSARGVRKTMACGDQPLAGRLLAVRPQLDKGASAGISVLLPGGRREIVAWIRNYDPQYPETYWLRRPLDLPRGSRLKVDGSGKCAIDVIASR
jgi:mono/diheme cytochrome c family protein